MTSFMERRSAHFRALKEKWRNRMIAKFTKKYYQSGEKKWLHHLSNLGVDVDYQESDLAAEPRY